jgi:RNA polymerase sigma factor (sigma-70 family)
LAVDVEALYRRYAPMVLRRCRRLLENEEKAVDAMQDVFVQLIRREGTLNEGAPSSLLYTMATNICLNILRAERSRPRTRGDEILLTIAGTDDPEARALNRHLLDRLFARELPSTKTIAVMHFVDGLTYEEVAREVGLSVSGVRKRLRTLKERVKEIADA